MLADCGIQAAHQGPVMVLWAGGICLMLATSRTHPAPHGHQMGTTWAPHGQEDTDQCIVTHAHQTRRCSLKSQKRSSDKCMNRAAIPEHIVASSPLSEGCWLYLAFGTPRTMCTHFAPPLKCRRWISPCNLPCLIDLLPPKLVAHQSRAASCPASQNPKP